MRVSYKTRIIRDLCEDSFCAEQKYGSKAARELLSFMGDAFSATSIAEIPDLDFTNLQQLENETCILQIELPCGIPISLSFDKPSDIKFSIIPINTQFDGVRRMQVLELGDV